MMCQRLRDTGGKLGAKENQAFTGLLLHYTSASPQEQVPGTELLCRLDYLEPM